MTCYFYDSNLVGGKAVRIRRQGGKETMKISFKRTVRVPDNDAISELPPDMGNFPLYKVSSYAQSLPAEMVKTGGIFMPMYRKSYAIVSHLLAAAQVKADQFCSLYRA